MLLLGAGATGTIVVSCFSTTVVLEAGTGSTVVVLVQPIIEPATIANTATCFIIEFQFPPMKAREVSQAVSARAAFEHMPGNAESAG